MSTSGSLRVRWAAIGAAIAVSLGAGGFGIAQAVTSSGEKSIYSPIEPCRLVDTRPQSAVGPRTVGIGPQEIFTLGGWGAVGGCTLPTGTTGLALNVTAVRPTRRTFLTLFPAGGSVPATSNVNPAPGQPATPNAVNVGLDSTGQFSVFNNNGVVHVVVDVVGVYDDHNHDDRYHTQAEVYTKSEVDALLAGVASRASLSDDTPGGELTSVGAVYDSVSVAVPTQGTVVVTASASFVNGNFGASLVRCWISDDASADSSAWQSMRFNAFGDTEATAVARGFSVAAGETFVASFMCFEQFGEVALAEPSMTAVYVPA